MNVAAKFELLDPAATLGFPAPGRAGAQPPAFEPAALSDAAPVTDHPDGSGSSGIVTFFNQSGYVAEFAVVFVQAGQPVRLPTGKMTLGQRRSVALPADATEILVVGDVVGAHRQSSVPPGAPGASARRNLLQELRHRVPPGMGPQLLTCAGPADRRIGMRPGWPRQHRWS